MGMYAGPPPERASDAERDRAVGALRDRSAEGLISSDTFVRRMDRALRARNRNELDELERDLPPRSWLARQIVDGVAALSSFTARVQAAWREPRVPRLALPEIGRHVVVVGRDPVCDFVLSDPTVSRRHAEIRHVDGGWLIVDLASRNGTRVNGWRQSEPASVRPGDLVSFGAASFHVCTR